MAVIETRRGRVEPSLNFRVYFKVTRYGYLKSEKVL